MVHEPNSTTLIPTCAVDSRERHYYTSTMHSLRLYVQFFHELDATGNLQELDGAFLIKYQGSWTAVFQHYCHSINECNYDYYQCQQNVLILTRIFNACG